VAEVAVTGLILAGGRGTRMGSVEKGLQPFRGKAMIAHVIERLAPQVAALAINANQERDAYRTFGLQVWPDRVPDFAGPLAGLEAGLAMAETDFVAAVPCDSPFLPADLIARLAEALAHTGASAAFAVTGIGAARRAHPVFCLLHRNLLPALRTYLDGGGRKVGAWLQDVQAATAVFEDDAAFQNINTLDELQRFETP
jgi:molybdenum cofactor guanylyltransferase